MSKKLLENHPAMIKFNKLCSVAEELGIDLSVDDYGGWHLHDENYPNIDFFIKDIGGSDDRMHVFPPACEVKIIYEP